ncbi:MAG: helix-turn-helix transcriptional regulator [Cyclobacteriaceae bacterium]
MLDELKITIGKVLFDLRNEKGLSQEKLANLTDLDRSYISRIERGLQNPSVGNLFSISKALEVSPSEFVQLIENSLSK